MTRKACILHVGHAGVCLFTRNAATNKCGKLSGKRAQAKSNAAALAQYEAGVLRAFGIKA